MKKALIIIPVLLAACSSLDRKQTANESAKASERNTYSYAMGMTMGESLKEAGIDINTYQVYRGMDDFMAGQKTELSAEEKSSAMALLQQKVREIRVQKLEETRLAGEQYLKENANKAGVITTESGLQYMIIAKGRGENASLSDTVKVHYRGNTTDGNEFDSSFSRGEPSVFPVNRVIKGWTEALQLMNPGSRYRIFVPADMAYGPREMQGIPGNSALIFDIELIEIVKKDVESSGEEEPDSAESPEEEKAPAEADAE